MSLWYLTAARGASLEHFDPMTWAEAVKERRRLWKDLTVTCVEIEDDAGFRTHRWDR